MNERKFVGLFIILMFALGVFIPVFNIPPVEALEVAPPLDRRYNYSRYEDLYGNHSEALLIGTTYYQYGKSDAGSYERIYLTDDESRCTAGFVWKMNEVQGANITKALIRLPVQEYSQTYKRKNWMGGWIETYATYKVYGYKAVDSDQFSDKTDFLSRMASRTVEEFEYVWQPHNDWDAYWIDKNTFYHRSLYLDVTDIVQEIVDQPAWASGNNITIFVENVVPDPFRDNKVWRTYFTGLAHDTGADRLLLVSTTDPHTITELDNDPLLDGFTIGGVNYKAQQSRTFYSNYTNRFYGVAVIDGNTWISGSQYANQFSEWFKLLDNEEPSTWNLDVWLEPNGRYFWVGYNNDTGIFWRKGELSLTNSSF